MLSLTPAILWVVLTLAHAEFEVRLLTGADGLVTGKFSDSVLLSLPPCSFAGQSVNLEVQNTATNENKTLYNIFKVPECRFKRGLITASTITEQYSFSRNIGYQVQALTNGTLYRFQYIVGSDKSNSIPVTTRTATDLGEISDGLPARSGAMVVITVLLSIAMFLLIVGLVVAVILTHGVK